MSDPSPSPDAGSRSQQLNSEELSRLSERLGQLLRVGVYLSALLLVAGLVASAALHGSSSVDPGSFTASKLTWGVVGAQGPVVWIVVLGLVLLVATPVGRVVLSLEAFAGARETDYVGILVLVLGVMLASVLVGAFL